MMASEIQKRIKSSEDDGFMHTVMAISDKFNQSISDTLNMPIPHYIATIEYLNKTRKK